MNRALDEYILRLSQSHDSHFLVLKELPLSAELAVAWSRQMCFKSEIVDEIARLHEE